MTSFQNAAFGLAILAAGALAWFGFKMTRVEATRTKGALMIVMALVLVGNVLIWTL